MGFWQAAYINKIKKNNFGKKKKKNLILNFIGIFVLQAFIKKTEGAFFWDFKFYLGGAKTKGFGDVKKKNWFPPIWGIFFYFWNPVFFFQKGAPGPKGETFGGKIFFFPKKGGGQNCSKAPKK